MSIINSEPVIAQYLTTIDQITCPRVFLLWWKRLKQIARLPQSSVQEFWWNRSKTLWPQKNLGHKETTTAFKFQLKTIWLMQKRNWICWSLPLLPLDRRVYRFARSIQKLNAKTVQFLPIFCRNLAKIYAQHNLQSLQLRLFDGRSPIARTKETFISFSQKCQTSEYIRKKVPKAHLFGVRFLDSVQFMYQGFNG